ncbi:MAG: hypothetical protein AAGU27_26880 [Dehalobacterium sp.]
MKRREKRFKLFGPRFVFGVKKKITGALIILVMLVTNVNFIPNTYAANTGLVTNNISGTGSSEDWMREYKLAEGLINTATTQTIMQSQSLPVETKNGLPQSITENDYPQQNPKMTEQVIDYPM